MSITKQGSMQARCEKDAPSWTHPPLWPPHACALGEAWCPRTGVRWGQPWHRHGIAWPCACGACPSAACAYGPSRGLPCSPMCEVWLIEWTSS